MRNLQNRRCRECVRSFMGGPRAYYCPSCRIDRQRATWRRFQQNKRLGKVRPLGSIDRCERCNKEYSVEGGLQRFCPECQPINAAEHDRRTSLEHYHKNRDKINPPRNEQRRERRNCDWCNKEYTRFTRSLTCSDKCRRLRKNKLWLERYHKNKK